MGSRLRELPGAARGIAARLPDGGLGRTVARAVSPPVRACRRRSQRATGGAPGPAGVIVTVVPPTERSSASAEAEGRLQTDRAGRLSVSAADVGCRFFDWPSTLRPACSANFEDW